MKCLRFLAIFLMGLATAALASPNAALAEPALPGEPCEIEPPRDSQTGEHKWTPQERWAWKQICEGREADFNQLYGVTLDPKVPEGWNDDRKLSQTFLETVLLDEDKPFRTEITRKGVRIIGAWFPEPIDLENADLDHDLWLIRSRFDARVNLRGLRTSRSLGLKGVAAFDEVIFRDAEIDGELNLQGAAFNSTLNMDSVYVGQHLRMHEAEFADVILNSSEIVGIINMNDSRFSRKLQMDKLQVGSSLFMRGAEFDEVWLAGATIGGQLSMTVSSFAGKTNMEELQVSRSLWMFQAQFREVTLDGARIGSDLVMNESKFTGKLSMSSIVVERRLLMARAEFVLPIPLRSTKVESNLTLSGAKLQELDLTQTHIGGELRFGPRVPSSGESRLILHNSYVDTLEDPLDAWPKSLELYGFTYSRLGPSLDVREAEWFLSWLAKDESYSPQPYQQLASVLRAAGHAEKADDILYAGKERERTELKKAGAWASWLWSTLKLVLIGHGYRIYYALFWVVGLVVLGACVFSDTRESARERMLDGLAFSFDMLLPIIRLREKHYRIDFADYERDWRHPRFFFKGTWRPARYYFYMHQLMGYVLASFLIAGLSGLTK